jgi:alpha/beta superfamily hydrolase
MALFTDIPETLTTSPFLLEGSVGPIEAVWDLPPAGSAEPAAIALCCHPHPLFGGSMTNKVIHTVARSCAAAGAVTLRFNFRGVGRSAGSHDHGNGEASDIEYLAVILRRRWPGLPLWLSGFSFGAWVSLTAASVIAPARLISVAPPVGRWDFSKIKAPACPWLIVQGDRDEIVDAAAVTAWVEGLRSGATLVHLAEAEHFFHGQLIELRTIVSDFLAPAVI